MPELPEVEVVRRGLAEHVRKRTIADVAVAPPARGAPPPRGRRRLRRPPGRSHDHRGAPPRQVPLAGARRRCGRRRRRARPPRHERSDARRRPRQARREAPAHPGAVRRRRAGAAVRRPAHVRRALGRTRSSRPSAAASCPPRSRTSPATRWTPRSTSTPPWRASAAAAPRSSGRCWTRPSSPASATSTPTRRCGWPACTVPAPPRSSPGRRRRAVLTAAADVMNAALGRGRHVVRHALRQRQRRLRLLRPLAQRLRPGRPPLRPLRHPDPARGVHEPRQLQLPALPAPPAVGQSQPFRLNATYSAPATATP